MCSKTGLKKAQNRINRPYGALKAQSRLIGLYWGAPDLPMNRKYGGGLVNP